MSDSRFSRRQFLVGSIATGIGGFAFQNATPLLSAAQSADNQDQSLTLSVTGDRDHGYGVEFLFKGERAARHNGEFSAVFQNEDRSLEDRFENWRASAATTGKGRVALSGNAKLINLNTNVSIQVEYDVVAPRVTRRRVRFRQADSYVLRYRITNSLEAFAPPARFWSFDQFNCQGGALHEYFPAAGFRTVKGTTVGLLTDAGYRNQWSRIIRRDGKPLKPAPWEIPDVRLYSARRNDEQKGAFSIEQTFGEALVRESGAAAVKVELPPTSGWRKRGDLLLENNNGAVLLVLRNSNAGLTIPLSAKNGQVYSWRFRYRSSHAFAIQVWDADDQLRQLANISLYNDRLAESPADWTSFQTEILFHSQIGRQAALVFTLAESEQATQAAPLEQPVRIELRDLEVHQIPTQPQSYHRLDMDRPEQKTSFLFVDDMVPDTLRGYRLASQQYLAEGLGFKGDITEKVLYADVMMLSWAASPAYAQPMLAPSIWYSAAGEMYMRDSFFALNGIHNRELNEKVFELWGKNQGDDGSINTLVEPGVANLERKSNDSTPLWLIWALQNRRRFRTELPMEQVQKAAQYFLHTYDRRHDGICWAQFVMGQLDVIDYPEGTSDICENQGLFAVLLRVLKELNIDGMSSQITEDYIQKAEAAYRSYYDAELKFLRPARDIKDAIGFAELFPEFLSLWLFGRKILSDDMVLNHLNRIPLLLPDKRCPHPEAEGTVRPIFIGLKPGGKGWDYFTETWHPMISKTHGANYANHNMDGIYYNGGSWMRIEICGYVCGKLHGWSKAEQAIANRLWAEINTSPDFPTSHEYLATDPAHPFFGYHRVFAWNAFVLLALEIAGLRRPEMDPDYGKLDSEPC